MNVIADGGLVGIVTNTGKDWATVRSIIDDSSNVSASGNFYLPELYRDWRFTDDG